MQFFKIIFFFTFFLLFYNQSIDQLFPSPISPSSFSITPPHVPPATTHVSLLSYNISRLPFLHAPESFTVDSLGRLYMGLRTGAIVRTVNASLGISPDAFEPVCVTGNPPPHIDCTDPAHELVCGRPLGLHFDASGRLIVADSLGLLSVDVERGLVTTLATHDVDGAPLLFPNALAIHPRDGTIFLTDSSTRFRRMQVLHEVLESGEHGRLCAYFPGNASLHCLVDCLPFPNGISFAFADALPGGSAPHGPAFDYDALLLTSTTRNALFKIHLPSRAVLWRRDGYPGILDNIVPRPGHRSFYIGCSNAPSPFLSFLAPFPRLRKELARLIPPSWILHFQRPYGLVLEVDSEGELLAMLTDPSGSISFISELFEFDGNLLFGSFHNLFLGVISNWS